MATKRKAPLAPTTNGAPAVAAPENEPNPSRMTEARLERRVATLETEVARLKAVFEEKSGPDQLGWRRIVGSFANDPAFDEAMRLGREWRESVDRKRRSRKVKSSDDRS
jgi:hypothetical protein